MGGGILQPNGVLSVVCGIWQRKVGGQKQSIIRFGGRGAAASERVPRVAAPLQMGKPPARSVAHEKKGFAFLKQWSARRPTGNAAAPPLRLAHTLQSGQATDQRRRPTLAGLCWRAGQQASSLLPLLCVWPERAERLWAWGWLAATLA